MLFCRWAFEQEPHYRNNLLQLTVELTAFDPIYWLSPITTTNSKVLMQTDTIDKFLADSRRYLAG